MLNLTLVCSVNEAAYWALERRRLGQFVCDMTYWMRYAPNADAAQIERLNSTLAATIQSLLRSAS